MCNFGRRYQEEEFNELISNLDQWFRRCRLKDVLSGTLAVLLFRGAKPFMQFERRYHGEFGPVVQEEVSFKDILIRSSDGLFVQWSRTICANLADGIKRNNSVKLFLIWTSGSGDVF